MSIGNQKFGFFIISVGLCMAFFTSAQEPLNAKDVENRKGNLVFLVRHFEKQSPNTQSKHTKDPELTERGLARAQALAAFLAEKNITSVFSTNYKRTLQTASPTAEQYGINITFYNPSDMAEFALQLTALAGAGNGNILVVGHSNTTPQLLKLLGGPDKVLSEDDYGDVFYLSLFGTEKTVANSFQHVMIE
ncbi:SixA phosphatase family protein [Brumicola nitratireducens]|uniref:Putative phosphohistidine phosphatase, SixA n=1 Tax=Glaciecola nitratireducens (strain JCM 12485 / KCTC 12276 / FR1064) TaxID=1085623 RepID=G4QI88_GLANF|nr:histidine phosphatase family protein [Glaciecola nitratireducens]AEP30702.1 putative phosphohistidine phosphatase, SixA [Glaciecola nitratireducens FR1064]